MLPALCNTSQHLPFLPSHVPSLSQTYLSWQPSNYSDLYPPPPPVTQEGEHGTFTIALVGLCLVHSDLRRVAASYAVAHFAGTNHECHILLLLGVMDHYPPTSSLPMPYATVDITAELPSFLRPHAGRTGGWGIVVISYPM